MTVMLCMAVFSPAAARQSTYFTQAPAAKHKPIKQVENVFTLHGFPAGVNVQTQTHCLLYK
jgi:hypothetical protein